MVLFVKPDAPRHLAEVVMLKLMHNPRTMMTANGELLTCYELTPHDASTYSREQRVVLRQRINNVMKTFGDGWAFWFEERKTDAAECEPVWYPDPASQLIGDERRKTFTRDGFQKETRYYVSISYALQSDASARLSSRFSHADHKHRSIDAAYLDQCAIFEKGMAVIEGQVLANAEQYHPMQGDDLTTYFANIFRVRQQRVRMPPLPMLLAESITSDTYVSGYAPRLGDHHVRTLSIKSHPSQTHPLLYAALAELDFPYRNVIRFLPFSKDRLLDVLQKRKRSWNARCQDMTGHMLANFFPSMADPTKDTENEDAMPIVVQAKMFLEMVHADEIGGGLYTHTVSVSHEDEAVANSRLQKVENAIANTQTLTARTDAKSLAAWLGSIPGHPYADLGRMPISSATLADVLPMTKPWAGQKHDTHFNAPALLRCKSTGGNPFFLSMHQDAQPLGHFLFIADSRAGKSTALSSFVAAFRQYDNSRIVLLDRFGSSRVITYALGGQFYDLGKPGSVSLQPLARVDDPYELTVANEWIVRRVEEQHRAASPESQKEITSALKIIGSRAPRFRTLSNFRTQVQDNDVKLAISPYCKGGAHGDLLDNSELRVGLDNDVIAYEMAALFERQAAFPAVLENIFHEISRKFDGRPTLFAVDEAWAFIDKISTADKLGGFLRESGKKNVSIILSTQTPMEIAQSKLAPVIAATIKQRIFGAMSNAREKQTAQILRDLDLTDEKIGIIASLTPRNEYVLDCPQGWSRFSLCLSPTEVALCGANSSPDQRDAERIYASGHPEEFYKRWLEHKGLLPAAAHAYGIAAE